MWRVSFCGWQSHNRSKTKKNFILFPESKNLLWVNCVPKWYVEVLTSGTYQCELIWKLVLCRYNQVKMKSCGWALMTGVLIGRDTFGRRHIENTMWCEDWSEAAQATEHLPEARRESWNRPSEPGAPGRLHCFYESLMQSLRLDLLSQLWLSLVCDRILSLSFFFMWIPISCQLFIPLWILWSVNSQS